MLPYLKCELDQYLIGHPCRFLVTETSRLNANRHVCQHESHGLVVHDRDAESLSLHGILCGLVEGALSETNGTCCHGRPSLENVIFNIIEAVVQCAMSPLGNLLIFNQSECWKFSLLNMLKYDVTIDNYCDINVDLWCTQSFDTISIHSLEQIN